MNKEDFLRSQIDEALQIAEGRRVDLEGRQAIIDALERLLLELTPGDSEFHGNPGRCAQWAQRRLTAADALAEICKQLQSAAKPDPSGEPEFIIVIDPQDLAELGTALREYREAGDD